MKSRSSLRIATAALALIGSISVTHAADLAVAAVEPAAPIDYAFSWTGFYVGANVGYAFDGSNKVGAIDQTNKGLNEFAKFEYKGVFGGLQAGYNYQFGSAVVGLEGDIQAADLSDKFNPTFGPWHYIFHGKSDINWFGTVRPRVGFAWDRALFYATGGLAVAGVDHSVAGYGVFTGATVDMKNDDPLIGYVVGGGIEYAITDNWTARIEYQYLKFERKTVSATEVPPLYTDRTQEEPNFQSVRLGINYKF
ncbi:outer membrane protein [Labrys wisconsinensis]|uniref:Outer membrane immunogenic protein n=1 Tax=Labrys wisconsinensis TaxID=425677 RepID=A0ABU0JKP9_9HYPH|nr:outer membrane protein [Labrys wisconsinensis]MDQ0474866.1 outer membrane immunogenic protein [Labrys wisconsinensis]